VCARQIARRCWRPHDANRCLTWVAEMPCAAAANVPLPNRCPCGRCLNYFSLCWDVPRMGGGWQSCRRQARSANCAGFRRPVPSAWRHTGPKADMGDAPDAGLLPTLDALELLRQRCPARSICAVERTTRCLTAILAADTVGYSGLMGADEEGTHERLSAHLWQFVGPKITEHKDHVAKTSGDGCWRNLRASSTPCTAPPRCSAG
jgi:hypothetical protein